MNEITSEIIETGSKIDLIKTNSKSRKVTQYIAALSACFAAFSCGIILGWTSQTSKGMLDGDFGFPITETELSWIGSLMLLGASVLSLGMGPLCDQFGRRAALLFLVAPSTIGWALLIWPHNVNMVYAGRFITGMIAGGNTIGPSLYISEIAEKDIRGMLGSFVQMMISIGILFGNVVAALTSLRRYTIICACVPVVFTVIFYWMPETPIYLLRKGNAKEAEKSLEWLRGKSYDIAAEMKELEENLQHENVRLTLKVATKSLRKKSTRKACVIGFLLMISRVTCGIDAITIYTSYIFYNSGMPINLQLGIIGINVVQVMFAVVQSLVVDKYGRKILLLLSSFVISLSLAVIGVVLMLKLRSSLIDEQSMRVLGYLPLIALVAFFIAFSIGLGPIPWVTLGEIFPQEIKSVAASMAAFSSWVASFIIVKLFLMVDVYWGGDVAFFIFTGFSACTFLFTILCVPETKNKSFEEIQQQLG